MATRKEVFTKAMALTDVFSAEEIEVFKKAIASLDKRSSKPTKLQIANEAIKAEIREVLTAEPKTAKAIADAAGIESTNKVASLLRQMEGVIVTEGKGKNPKTYSIAE